MRHRFDQIQNAYDILKNPRRRVAYNRYSTTNWDQQGQYTQDSSSAFNKDNFEAYRRAHAHRTNYSFENDESFWQAGTWEDYYKMKYGRKPPTKEELDKNKYKILFGVVAVGVLSFGIQVMLAIDSSNEYYAQTRLMNLKSVQDLQNSVDNYGEGSNQIERLRRFLLSRRSSLAVKEVNEPSDSTKTFQDEEDEILVKYAQKRVSKWD
ncbi:hypothetical protein DFJ63DRAFT_317845 [Scheffersomyces coipomensis]|uniref:uncharacterized protein n=1 Tax=Scheffersomyces coipomensis TaxID=1788519 RepID=UPI00315D7A67